ncbi:MAG: flagellar protein FlaG [bacterium]|nr:flagellar protein FlaG [bacterium]
MNESINISGLSGKYPSTAKFVPSRSRPRSISTEARSAAKKPVETPKDHHPSSNREVSETVALANRIAEVLDRKISFSYDDKLDQIIVKIVKKSTGETIRQIPPQEMVELIANLREGIRGLLLNQAG